MANRKRAAAKKRLSVAEKGILVVAIILIVVCTAAVGVLILMNVNLFQDQSGDGNATITEEVQTPQTIRDKVSTFLVLGVSDDENERADTQLTDTIMLVTFDFEQKSASVLQVPRDSYIGNESSTGKINAIYGQNSTKWDYSGIEGLSTMLNEMFQVNIDHYVTIQMDAFAKVIDDIGGVPMDVPTDMELNGVQVSAGEQVLTGEEAIAVVRTRNVYLTADIGRLDTQKIFMSSLIKKCLGLDAGQMTKLIPTMFSSVTTDLTLSEALAYYNTAKDIDMENMQMMTVPGNGEVQIKGQSIYSVYPNHVTAMLNAYFRPYSEPITADMLKIQTVGTEPKVIYNEDKSVVNLDDLEAGSVAQKDGSTSDTQDTSGTSSQTTTSKSQTTTSKKTN